MIVRVYSQIIPFYRQVTFSLKIGQVWHVGKRRLEANVFSILILSECFVANLKLMCTRFCDILTSITPAIRVNMLCTFEMSQMARNSSNDDVCWSFVCDQI